MAKSRGASNNVLIYAMTDATTLGSLLYTFSSVESSGFTRQPSNVPDLTIKDQIYDEAYQTLMTAVLPDDPSAGSTAAADPELEDGSGGGASASSTASLVA